MTYLDALLALPSLDDAQVSPDGAWAAWTWMNAGPTTDVYAAPTDGSAAPVKLTNTPENARLVGWTSDSRAVLVEQDHEGDERVQIFRVDLNRPGLMQPLTEPSPNYFLHGLQLHPNGRWLIYSANVDFDTFVQNIKGQLLIVQGLRDPNVTPENVRVVSQALQQAGVEYQTLVFEDEGHGISRPKNQKLLYQRLAEFFGEAFTHQRSNV
jgi:Tol biopolymer transport system component